MKKLVTVTIAALMLFSAVSVSAEEKEVNIISDSVSFDTNKDGYINIADIIPLHRHLIGDAKLSDTELLKFDFNGDGVSDKSDLNIFLEKV